MATAASLAPRQLSEVAHWDVEADVVIVGFGCAGAAAAISARTAGADVLVIERAGGAGGAAALSGGMLYLGGGTALQAACGIDDTPEAMFDFLAAACGPHVDEAKVSAYCNHAAEHFDWVAACGVPFEATFLPDQPGRGVQTDAGLVWVGENSYPFDRLAKPAPRGHRPATPGHGGWLLMQHLASTAHEVGVRHLFGGLVERLVVDDGAVVGVEVRTLEGRLCVRGRRGIVLAGGGFVFNDEMLRQFAPTLLGHGKIGTDGDDGRTIQLARAVGAAIKRMDAGNASLMVPAQLLQPSLLVNRVGQRFINEDTYFGRVGQHALFHEGAETFLVLDGATYDAVPVADRQGIKPTWVSDSVAELEREMELPAGALQQTVSFYNDHAAIGEDPLFHKRSRWLRPLGPPFGAVDLRPRPRSDGTLKSRYWVFTLGGLATTVDGEVLDLGGEPIPGLYAAGRTTSGIQAWGYISGTSLGEGTYFGRRAGGAAAATRL
jgi:3-oxo-5alpha-steroid 4-dehydrogenase